MESIPNASDPKLLQSTSHCEPSATGKTSDERTMSSQKSCNNEAFWIKLNKKSTRNKISPDPSFRSGPSSREVGVSQLSVDQKTSLLRAIDAMKKENSENLLDILNSGRESLRIYHDQFKQDQAAFKEELRTLSKIATKTDRPTRENMIPLSVFLQMKSNNANNADMRVFWSKDSIYCTYYEAFLPENTENQNTTDRAAVLKFIRRRERQKLADENKAGLALTKDSLEQKSLEILKEMDNASSRLENDRHRYNQLINIRRKQAKNKTNNWLQATEIIERAQEANTIRERTEQQQKTKILSRLSVFRNNINQKKSVNFQEKNTEGRFLKEESSKSKVELGSESHSYSISLTEHTETNPVTIDNQEMPRVEI